MHPRGEVSSRQTDRNDEIVAQIASLQTTVAALLAAQAAGGPQDGQIQARVPGTEALTDAPQLPVAGGILAGPATAPARTAQHLRHGAQAQSDQPAAPSPKARQGIHWASPAILTPTDGRRPMRYRSQDP